MIGMGSHLGPFGARSQAVKLGTNFADSITTCWMCGKPEVLVVSQAIKIAERWPTLSGTVLFWLLVIWRQRMDCGLTWPD